MSELLERVKRLREQVETDRFMRVTLLNDAQFTNADVEAASYVSATQLHNWVSRGWIKLSAANPGRGRRRLYTGHDAIAVAVAATLQPFGMMQVADQLIRVNSVGGRADRMFIDPSFQPGYALAIVPYEDGEDWLYVPISAEASEPELPTPSCVVLDLDRLIVETLENLLLVIAGEPPVARQWPRRQTNAEAEDTYLEEMGNAYRDEDGNRIYRGLTVEESTEFDRLNAASFGFRVGTGGERLSDEETDRYVELQSRNEHARQQHNAERYQERMAQMSRGGADE